MSTEAIDRAGIDAVGGSTGQRRPDFRQLLGEAAWSNLPRAVQARFGSRAHCGHDTLYRGSMSVRASVCGRILAHVCRLIGTPVAPWTGEQVRMHVRVFECATGIVWERKYEFADHAPVVVRSTKQLDSDGHLVESLGAGLHMRLRVYEALGQLHFLSSGYYFAIGALRIALPGWFLPGTTHVIHADLGAGNFRFSMVTRHRWLGELYAQHGVFR
jgi:hypothetical protein